MCSRLQEKHCAGNTKANWVEMKGVFALKAISVLEWNINQRGGKGRGNIPPWVKDEINGYDIVILTEFCTGCDGRAAFISELEQRGYHCAVSDNSNGNDILIAIFHLEFYLGSLLWYEFLSGEPAGRYRLRWQPFDSHGHTNQDP